jgi:vacuolar-type H+-ATPase subunit I/STV1
MNVKPDELIKSMLGEDFFENLQKTDVYKMHNRSVTSVSEVSTGLKIVPRTVMSFLIANLSNLNPDDNKTIELPFAADCYLQVTKKDRDVFSGYIYSKGKKINEFVNRSIPGLGLVLMTTFELYDIEDLKDTREKENKMFNVSKLQDMIDERLRLHSLISRVVDNKIAQRDAVEILVKEKIAQALKQQEKSKENIQNTKAKKLKQYLERNKVRQEEAQIEKREAISCPDCGCNLYSGGKAMDLCICYGHDWGKKIKIQKNESRNIEMLLKTLKSINKE